MASIYNISGFPAIKEDRLWIVLDCFMQRSWGAESQSIYGSDPKPEPEPQGHNWNENISLGEPYIESFFLMECYF